MDERRRGGRGYALEFQDGRHPLQQGVARQCRQSIRARQGSVVLTRRVQMGHHQMENLMYARGDGHGRHCVQQYGGRDCRENLEQPELLPGQTCRCGRDQNQGGQHRRHCG